MFGLGFGPFPGIRFRETLRGTWHRLAEAPAVAHAIEFTIEARAAEGISPLGPRAARAAGRLSATGLASDVLVEGELRVDLIMGRRIRYDLVFRGDDGKAYQLVGQKDLSLLRLAETLTTLPVTLREADGPEIGTGVLRFDRAQLPAFLSSFRPL